MYINETYPPFDLTHPVGRTYLGRDGEEIQGNEEVLVEHMIDVYINEKLTMKLVCIPQFLAELVLGRLLSEGMIRGADDVESIFICEYGSRAKVVLKDTSSETADSKTADSKTADSKTAASEATSSDAADSEYIEITPTCCTNNHVLNNYYVKYSDKKKVTPIPWKKDWIFALADKFAAGMPIHSKTWSTHSAFLAQGDQILFECEDIGRHNALDKAIGYAIRHGIDLTQCILYSSGRIPTDMVMKVILAGVPILASKASLTLDAVELAHNYDLTLICAARRDRMKLYTGKLPEE